MLPANLRVLITMKKTFVTQLDSFIVFRMFLPANQRIENRVISAWMVAKVDYKITSRR